MSDWEDEHKRRVLANGHRGACSVAKDEPCDCDEPVRLHKTVKAFIALLIIIPATIAAFVYSVTIAPELTGMVLFGVVITAIGLVVIACTIVGLWEWAQSIAGAGYDPDAKQTGSASHPPIPNE